MAAAMAMRSQRAFKSGAAPHSRRSVVVRAAQADKPSLRERLAPSLLAAMMTLSTGLATVDAVYAPAAWADEDEEVSPYQKRQIELEKRREMLREAREKAAARAAGTAVQAPAPAAEPEKPAADIAGQAARLKSSAAKAYDDAAKKSFSAPPPAPEPSSSFSFPTPPDPWRTPAAPAPAAPAPVAPAPVAPAPAPAAPKVVAKPAPAPTPAPAKAPAKADEDTRGKRPGKPPKRRGPLPLWFAELLLLGAFGGTGLAVTKYSKESGEVAKLVGAKVVEAYAALEKLAAQQKKKSA